MTQYYCIKCNSESISVYLGREEIRRTCKECGSNDIGQMDQDVDMVNNPPHYRNHPSGVDCIVILEHFNFCLGNAMKYIWRAGKKGDSHIEDLEKAAWYLNREIERLKGADSTD